MNTKSLDKNLLLLDDQRIGNYKQLKAIAHFLKSDYQIQELKLNFNSWIKIPNILHFPKSIAVKNSHNIISQIKSPNLILSCGRRSAPFAVWLKYKFPNSQIIQILNPNLPCKYFDKIITPKHDNFQNAAYQYFLPPNLENMETLAKKTAGFEYLKSVNEEKLCIIIGGSSKNKKLTNKEFENFQNLIDFISSIQNQKILLTTSRRTDKELLNIIDSAITKNNNIESYLYRDNDEKNPYGAFLYYADKIIVTGDSISMVADAIMTKKPVLIYDDFAGKKQLAFLKQIYKNQYALKFTESVKIDDFEKIKKYQINEAEEIANLIKKL